MKRWIGLTILVLLVGLTIFRIVSNRPGFTGTRTKNPDSYILDIRQMNGTDHHTLRLTAGDALHVTFETQKGTLRMEITAPDGATLYAGNGEETTEFQLAIPETGTYTVTVTARHAAGSIRIQVRDK